MNLIKLKFGIGRVCMIFLCLVSFLYWDKTSGVQGLLVQDLDGNRDSFFAQKISDKNTCKDPNECKNVVESPREKRCWGYETDCQEKWFITPKCNNEEGYRHFASNEEKVQQFWKEADFGYVKKFKDSLQQVCKPKDDEVDGSSFSCGNNLAICQAQNLYIDLRDDGRSDLQQRFKSDIFKDGQLGAFCDFDAQAFKSLHSDYNMELTSWFNQLDKFSSIPFNPLKEGHCDVVVERPTIIMKLDAVVNMYHHFCDFLNLYATLHVNGSMDTDINIVLWESYARHSLGNFGATWKVFTRHPVIYLGHEYGGKRVCFKNAIFALLPRMVFGLFYNTPLIPGCSNSGLFKAFSEHVLGKLTIKQERNLKDADQSIRVTFLSRGTKYRVVLNEDKLVKAAMTVKGVTVQVSTYSWDMPFVEQLQVTHNSDIFIGMHGAGLAHALFLPDWALLFELYNCGDTNCYRDLAQLRGLSYMTWERNDKVTERTEELHPEYSDHPKFRNYEFDVTEFTRLLTEAVSQVRKYLSKLSQNPPSEL